MFRDPIVDEVRAARERHAARFNYDLAAIVAHLRKRQQEMDRPVVTRPAKRLDRKLT